MAFAGFIVGSSPLAAFPLATGASPPLPVDEIETTFGELVFSSSLPCTTFSDVIDYANSGTIGAVAGEVSFSGLPIETTSYPDTGTIEPAPGELSFSNSPVETTSYPDVGTIEPAIGEIVFYPTGEGYPGPFSYVLPGAIEPPPLSGIEFSTPIQADFSYVRENINYVPTNMWPGYTSDGTNITIPIAEIPGLSVAEANAVTGDWRDVFQALLLNLDEYMDWTREDAVGVYIRPRTVHIAVFENWNLPTVNQMKRSVRIKFNIHYAMQTLAEEPT